MSFLEKDYREIITKAVCGRGRCYKKETHTISPPQRATSILGCWVINHTYNAKKRSKDTVEVNGSFDINIWYSHSDNTKTEVVTERVTYKDHIRLSTRDDHCIDDDYDIFVKVVQQPNCLECEIEKQGHKLSAEIERELIVHVIGETKVYVKVDPKGVSMDDEDWDEELTDDELADVDPDFVKKNTD